MGNSEEAFIKHEVAKAECEKNPLIQSCSG